MSSKFKEVLDGYFLSQDPMYYIFLETLGKIQFNDNDSSHHDPHQEGQDDQECPPSSKKFLMKMTNVPVSDRNVKRQSC